MHVIFPCALQRTVDPPKSPCDLFKVLAPLPPFTWHVADVEIYSCLLPLSYHTVCCISVGGDVCVVCVLVTVFPLLSVQSTVESVAVFRERLQDQYNKMHAPGNLELLKVPGFMFFQPLIYEAKEVIPDSNTIKRLHLGEEPIADYGRVMQAASEGKRVLLEGPPGSGKSTVSRQLCKDWAVCVLGTEFELVVLVRLRELRKKEKVELANLLRAAYWNLPDGVVEHIEAVDGNGVLFILDGYDEIKSQTEGVPTVIEKLICRSYLQHSSVIVTSRGIAAESLYDKQHLDKRFVIQGLRKDEIPVFVRYYFGGSEANVTEVQSLLDRLDADPQLIAACSNTLALSIVCYLHSEQETIPSTFTGLYGQFLGFTLREVVKRNPELKLPKILRNYNEDTFLQVLPSILHPGSPFSNLSAVAELALEGILKDKFVFDSSDEKQSPEGFDGYGLLDYTVITWGQDTKQYRLNFMHLTLQEFMAALLVASWTPENQTTFWRERFVLQYDGHVLSEDRFLTMLTFYCGLSGLEHKGVQDHLLEEVGNVWIPIAQTGQERSEAAASISYHRMLMRIAAASGNKDFVCRLLSLFDKKVEVDVRNTLDSADAVWCLNSCKESIGELVVTSYRPSVDTVAKFLCQLNQLTSLFVLQLSGMVCSTEHSESTCSEGRYTALQWCTCVVCP